ncbi:MAG: hypothetical protein KJ732_02030, partial [Candidatus Margulisbacteria bacterium]|nr:hypothetical protein [Candidatus Margulisiibacteriota bacterium]
MFMFILDAVLIFISFILAYFLRFEVLLFITPDSAPIFQQYFNILVFVTIIWLALFKLIGLYEAKKFTALIDELASLFLGVSLATLVLLGMLFLNQEFWFSRLVIVNVWWIALLLLGLSRLAIFWLRRTLRLRGWGVKNVLILGAGEMGQVLALKITQDKTLGYRVVGYLDDDPVKLAKTYNTV